MQAAFLTAHETRIPRHIGGQDRGETASSEH
jgi:hypothetical protein